ncbi:hypothetical protein GCM10027046_34300 [Uliginosibacterium flavum]|uniref:DUF4019 domain-containing protein n=1 Tax=Uliginosibacterium flavum TaxID=1396831 RepID=A0ABV2TMK6_9RHOO
MSFAYGLRSFLFVALVAITPFAWGMNEDPSVLDARQRLADAFSAKDKKAVYALISDPWGGFRFYESQTDEWWAEAGRSLREAKRISEEEAADLWGATRPYDTNRVTYSILRSGKPRAIGFVLRNSSWVLDLNSFLGPFPTGLRQPDPH